MRLVSKVDGIKIGSDERLFDGPCIAGVAGLQDRAAVTDDDRFVTGCKSDAGEYLLRKFLDRLPVGAAV